MEIVLSECLSGWLLDSLKAGWRFGSVVGLSSFRFMGDDPVSIDRYILFTYLYCREYVSKSEKRRVR